MTIFLKVQLNAGISEDVYFEQQQQKYPPGLSIEPQYKHSKNHTLPTRLEKEGVWSLKGIISPFSQLCRNSVSLPSTTTTPLPNPQQTLGQKILTRIFESNPKNNTY